MHAHHHTENLLKIRNLEQDNDRLLRKIRGLEQQLCDLELLHGQRVQELLHERRQEREKENRKQKELFDHLENSQNSREKVLKERIYGLEKQVELLKEQLGKEIKRRQTFILESSGISNEISELRHSDTNQSKMFTNSLPLISRVFYPTFRKTCEIRHLFTFHNMTTIEFTKNF